MITLREEGQFLNAYFTMPNAQDATPILLGSIRLGLLSHRPRRRAQFTLLMREIAGELHQSPFGDDDREEEL